MASPTPFISLLRCAPRVLLGLVLGVSVAPAATITVNSTSSVISDDGLCTFREAIVAANTNVKSGNNPGECGAGSLGLDTIQFAIGGSGVHTLQPPAAGAPTQIFVSEPLVIDGFSQTGSTPNSNPISVGLNGVLTIELDLSVSGPLASDIAVSMTVRGLVLNRSNQVAVVLGGDGGSVEGCYIGTNPAGTAAGPGNAQGGVVIGSAGNTIGGFSPDKRNLISGNSSAGVTTGLGANWHNNIIAGNLIGTNAAGTAALGNGAGVVVADSRQSNTLIADNLISGNSGFGVALGGLNSTTRSPGSILRRNLIGTDRTGTVAIPNSNGIVISDGNVGNQIGGDAFSDGNLISGNTNYGIGAGTDGNTIQGNRIGTNAAGTGPIPGHSGGGIKIGHDGNTVGGGGTMGNHIAYNSNFAITFTFGLTSINDRIAGNSIHDNVSGGIALGNPAAPDDHCDGDGGNNNGQNKPVLTGASIANGNVFVTGTLDSAAGTTFRIEFFSNQACKVGLFDKEQGKTYLGFVNVTTDGSCNSSFGPVSFGVPVGENVITATATDPAGNTSEFSTCVTAITSALSFYSIPPCRVVDTRNPNGPYGGPALVANTDRTFVFAGQCGVPVGAKAIVLNIATTGPTAGGDLRLYPAGSPLPLTSAINYNAGKTRADDAIIRLGAAGDLSVHVDQPSGTVHVILDVDGYFQ